MYTSNGDTSSTWKRLFPRSMWRQRNSLQLIGLSLISGVLLIFLFLIGLLIADLFVSRGAVVLQGDQIEVARERFGDVLDVVAQPEGFNSSEEIRLQNRGLLHSLWNFKDRIWASASDYDVSEVSFASRKQLGSDLPAPCRCDPRNAPRVDSGSLPDPSLAIGVNGQQSVATISPSAGDATWTKRFARSSNSSGLRSVSQ